MQPFDDVGTFWLPSDPDHQVDGELRFDGETFTLKVSDYLERVEPPSSGVVLMGQTDWKVHPVVLGRLRTDGEVTLLEVGGLPADPGFELVSETWAPSVAVLGATLDEPRFRKALIDFDVLIPWLTPPRFVSWDVDTPNVGTIDLSRKTLDEVSVAGAVVQVVAESEGTAGDHLDIRRRCWVTVETGSMSIDEVFDDWVGPIQQLLIVLLGRPVRLTELRVLPDQDFEASDANQRRRSGRRLSVVRSGMLVAPATDASWSNLRNWGTSSIYASEDLPIRFGELLAGWFEVRRTFGESITLLCGPFYAPFMYAEHRYSAAFQAAESIAQAKFTGAELAAHEHQARVAAVVDAARAAGVAERHVEWAQRILQDRNDKPLAAKITELLAGLGALGEAVLSRDPKFGRTAAGARARVAHPGGRGLTAVQRHWYGETLLWLVRAQLLVEAGLSLDVLAQQILDRGHFTQVVERLEQPGG